MPKVNELVEKKMIKYNKMKLFSTIKKRHDKALVTQHNTTGKMSDFDNIHKVKLEMNGKPHIFIYISRSVVIK